MVVKVSELPVLQFGQFCHLAFLVLFFSNLYLIFCYTVTGHDLVHLLQCVCQTADFIEWIMSQTEDFIEWIMIGIRMLSFMNHDLDKIVPRYWSVVCVLTV